MNIRQLADYSGRLKRGATRLAQIPLTLASSLRGHDQQYERQGYRVFNQRLNLAAVQRARDVIGQEVFRCESPLRRHPTGNVETHAFVDPDGDTSRRYVRNPLANPHQEPALPATRAAFLDLICSPELRDCLRELDGADEYAVHQIVLFFVGPGMEPHVDGWFLDTVPHGGAHTVWIPLEDTTTVNGPTGIFPWPRRRFLDGKALGLGDSFASEDIDFSEYLRYQKAILDRARSENPSMVVPQMKKGDFAVWSSLTPHGTLPARREGVSRLSLQVLVRPTNLKWGTFREIEFQKKPRDDAGKPFRAGWSLIEPDWDSRPIQPT